MGRFSAASRRRWQRLLRWWRLLQTQMDLDRHGTLCSLLYRQTRNRNCRRRGLHRYLELCNHQCSICRGLGVLTPPLVEDDPHTGDWKFWSQGVGFDPPVLIQQDQHNVQMISKYDTFHFNFEDRKAYCIWLQEMKPLDD